MHVADGIFAQRIGTTWPIGTSEDTADDSLRKAGRWLTIGRGKCHGTP